MLDASRLRSVAGRCAEKVFAGMGVSPGDSLESLLDLCDRWGVAVCFNEVARYGGGGAYLGNSWVSLIVLDPGHDANRLPTVLVHELAHHIAHGDAYEHLNYEEDFTGLDYNQFHESFAREVEFRFSGVRR